MTVVEFEQCTTSVPPRNSRGEEKPMSILSRLDILCLDLHETINNSAPAQPIMMFELT